MRQSTQRKRQPIADAEAFCLGAVAVCFLFVATHKLTFSSLWFDEGIEYWYSKYLVGPIPFNGDAAFNTQNMYERIVTTFQPPLYNVLMYFWLLINESAWWMRFFSVLMGAISLCGVYATIRSLSDYRWATAGSVLFTFNYHLCFYWQEAAEYALMLAFVSWLCYWFVKALLTKELKSVVWFVACSVGAIYSQYGAALLAIPLGLVILLSFALDRQWSLFTKSTLVFVAAVVIAGLPLLWFFLRVQLSNGNTNVMRPESAESLNTMGLVDVFKTWVVIVKGLLFTDFERPCALALAGLCTLFVFGAPIVDSNREGRMVSVACLLAYLFFYGAVKSGYYSYGQFLGGWNGSRVRYALFYIPFLICVITLGARGIVEFLHSKLSGAVSVRRLSTGMLCCAVACYALIGWTDSISPNWNKSDAGGLVQSWYELSGGTTPTIVYYGADALFSYYATQDPRYNDTVAANVAYQDWVGGKDEQALNASVDACLAKFGTRPERFYIAVCHWTDDLTTMLTRFENEGYTSTKQYSGSGAVLYELNLQEANQ